MFLRLSSDPRILLPLTMLGGFLTSLALYQGSHPPRALSGDQAPPRRAPNPSSANPQEALPAFLDPSASSGAGVGARVPFGAELPARSPATTLVLLPMLSRGPAPAEPPTLKT